MENQENTPDNTPNLSKKERRALRRQQKHSERESRQKKAAAGRFTFWFLAIIILAGAVGGIVWVVKKGAQNNFVPGLVAQNIVEDDHVLGPKDAKATLVEYSDFQCPACRSFNPILKQINKDLEGKIRFVYRHFPLPQHRQAVLAGIASEAAGRQGKFWEMSDVIFEKQNEWENNSEAKVLFIQYAEGLTLDMDKFKKDLEDSVLEERVRRDLQKGETARVDSTPTFFLNDKKIENPKSLEEFENVLLQITDSSS